MIGGKDHGFGFLVVGIAARVLAAVLVAVLALEAALAVFGVPVAVEMIAGALRAAQNLGRHRLLLPKSDPVRPN